jgi:hypothetical protein
MLRQANVLLQGAGVTRSPLVASLG